MNNLHLSYDGNQSNGIIFNDTYPTGALFTGAENKPNLSFGYDNFQYSEVFNTQDFVELNSIKRVMTETEQSEVQGVVTSWVQPLGQEGNPSPAQIAEQTIREAGQELERTNVAVTVDMYPKMTPEEQTAITDFRDAQLLIIQNGGTGGGQNGAPAPSPDSLSAFAKFGI